MRFMLLGMMLLGSMAARGQVSVEEAKARLEAKQRAAATQPSDREELDRLRRENAALKAIVGTLKEQVARLTAELDAKSQQATPDDTIAAAIKAKRVLKGMTVAQVQQMFLMGPTSTTEGPEGTTYVFQQGRGERRDADGAIFLGVGGIAREVRIVVRNGKVIDFTDHKNLELGEKP